MQTPADGGRQKPSFSRAPLFAAAAVIAITLGGILIAGDEDGSSTRPAGTPELSRELRFEDAAQGAVRITDPATGALITEFASGEGGFVRATLRGLARERRRASLPGAEAPFRLTAWSSGRLTLEDPVTGRFVDLGAFGQTQIETFTAILLANAAASHGKLAAGTRYQGGGLPR